MFSLVWLVAALLFGVLPTHAANSTLNLSLVSGDFANYVVRDNITSGTLLLSTPETVNRTGYSRFLVAFPAGNSGALTNFTAPDGTNNVSVSLVNGSLATVQRDTGGGQVGLQGTLSFAQSTVMNGTVMGGVRAMRDVVEGGLEPNPLFAWNVTSANATFVQLSRRWLNESSVVVNGTTQMQQLGMEWTLQAQQPGVTFTVQQPSNASLPPTFLFNVTNSTAGLVNFAVTLNETSLVGLGREDVFTAPNATVADVESQMTFLTYADKFTAGSWRFLTYFGRDTLFTLNLLLTNKTLTPAAIEAVLSAALSRINATSGEVCHEETIGDYATFVNMQNNESWRGNAPYYDYKMKDTHYLLLPAVSEYFLLYNSSTNATAFLNTTTPLQNGTSYATLLEANVQYVLNTTLAFADAPMASNLARIKQDVPVGNWRDSNTGLGEGTYPFDVNTAHVPAALYAIADLAAAGIINNTMLSVNGTETTLANRTRAAAQVWDQEASKLFEVSIDAQTAEQRVQAYTTNTSLTTALLYGNGSLNDTAANTTATNTTSTNTTSNLTLLPRQATNDTATNITYYALSLTDNFTTVDVLHSDVAFPLVFSRNITAAYLRSVLVALQPYPRGLLTNVGALIANPAYDGNATNAALFTNRDYHGTVVWGFMQAFMAKGLARVRVACQANQTAEDALLVANLPRLAYCDDAALMGDLSAAERLLYDGVAGAGPDNQYSELWSWSFDNATSRFSVVPFGAVATTKTEADAIQLWSFGFLALQAPA